MITPEQWWELRAVLMDRYSGEENLSGPASSVKYGSGVRIKTLHGMVFVNLMDSGSLMVFWGSLNAVALTALIGAGMVFFGGPKQALAFIELLKPRQPDAGQLHPE